MSLASTVKRTGRAGVRWVAAMSDRVLQPEDGITILGYHQVGAPRKGGVGDPPRRGPRPADRAG